MDEAVPFFEDALKDSERRLNSALGEQCEVRTALSMDDELFKVIEGIDHEKFRTELQYSLEELRDRNHLRGFVLFTVACVGRPVAFLFGYNDPADQSSFYLDTVATLIEGKGIGSILVTLALIYCYDVGYGKVELYTEEEDEKGRHLRQFYENLGFRYVSNDPKNGLGMSNDLNPFVLKKVYEKYLKTGDYDIDPRVLEGHKLDSL
ncbi:MAG: GNAT family N-acetyltransferase [Candidatus Bathyarchaeota archaeon]|nr:GNAT family N-acetyltransferase [Candidatus Bathyarchaeota archaeon]